MRGAAAEAGPPLGCVQVYAGNKYNVANWRFYREAMHIFCGPKWVIFGSLALQK